jgi:hypothetical protein
MGHFADSADSFAAFRNNFEMFTFLADQLAMPETERRGVLGLDEDAWNTWVRTFSPEAVPFRAAFQRRMAYAIRLMERMIENGLGTHPGTGPIPAALRQQQLPA